MNQLEKILYLNSILLEEMPAYQTEAEQFPRDKQSQRRLLRSLMNVRPALPLRRDYLSIQDDLLSAERAEKGVVDVETLPVIAADPRLVLWQGDITRLNADAIVNAANSGLTGCYCPFAAARRMQPHHDAAGARRANGTGQNHTRLQSAVQIRAPHRRPHHPRAAANVGLCAARILLPLLFGAGSAARAAIDRVLLHLHRRVSLSARTRGRDRRADRTGLFIHNAKRN